MRSRLMSKWHARRDDVAIAGGRCGLRRLAGFCQLKREMGGGAADLLAPLTAGIGLCKWWINCEHIV
jgi:hypothetical protein